MICLSIKLKLTGAMMGASAQPQDTGMETVHSWGEIVSTFIRPLAKIKIMR